MHIVSLGDNFDEMPKPILWKKNKADLFFFFFFFWHLTSEFHPDIGVTYLSLTDSTSSTFLVSNFKIHQEITKLWTGPKKKQDYFWSLITKCYLDLGATDLVLARDILYHVSIFLPSHCKIHQGMAKLWTGHKKDPIYDFWPLCVTLTLELHTSCARHIASWRSTFLPSHFKIHRGIAVIDRTRKRPNIWHLTPKCDLDLGA